MVIGIPAEASGIDPGRIAYDEGAFQTLLSYCEEVGVRHAAISPPMENGNPNLDAFLRIKDKLVNAGIIPYGGACFFARGGLGQLREGNFFDEEIREEQKQKSIELIECYGKAEVEPVTLFCCLSPEKDEAWNLAIDFLRSLVLAAEKVKVKLAVHPIPLTEGVFNRFATVERMFSEIESDYLGVCYDVAVHTQFHDDLTANFKALKSKMPIMHMRTIGNVTPEKRLEIKDGKLQDVKPKAEEVDFPKVMRSLLDINYDGILSLEHQRGPVAYALVVGYLKGLIEALEAKGTR